MASTVQTAGLGVAAVSKLAAEAGWFLRELPPPDEGIDAQLEGQTGAGRPSGRLLGVQIKSGESYFGNPTDGGWRYAIKANNLTYWRTYSLPVVLVLYDPRIDKAFWQVVRSRNLTPTASGGTTIVVPDDRVLDKDTFDILEELANEGLPTDEALRDKVLVGRRAQMDIGWMELIASGGHLFLEAEEQVATSSGRGALRLVAVDEDGSERTERDWPWAFLPGGDYLAELREVFPWADFRIDEKRYRKESYPAFVAEHGTWIEEDEAYEFDSDFDEWFEERYGATPRSYGCLAGGDTALWRLELGLNELGEKTLAGAREEEMEDALLDIAVEDRLAAEREIGEYRGEYVDAAAGLGVLETILFTAEDSTEALEADEVLWTQPTAQPLAARLILQHALGEEPTEALIAAFLARYKMLFDDDGQEWALSYADLRAWLGHLDGGS